MAILAALYASPWEAPSSSTYVTGLSLSASTHNPSVMAASLQQTNSSSTSSSPSSRAVDARANSSSTARPCFSLNHVDDSFIPALTRRLKIAVVQPIFTSTPYSQYKSGSFYAFYSKYGNANGNITTDLDLLTTGVDSGYRYNGGWGLSYGLYDYVSSKSAADCGLTLGRNVHLLNDINVSAGALFDSRARALFDVVVVPFSEYVTPGEFEAYDRFVAGGGTLVLIGASNFHVSVKYDAQSRTETLVRGHGWAFNGRSAWKSDASAWPANNTNWVGSIFCCFHRFQYNGAMVNTGNIIGRAMAAEFGDPIFKSYASHEENSVSNMTGTSIIATFANKSGTFVASYVHRFRRGSVVCMCIFGDDMILDNRAAQYFLLLGVVSASLGTTATCFPQPSTATAEDAVCTATVRGWSPTGTISWSSRGFGSIGAFSSTSCTLRTGGGCSVRFAGWGVLTRRTIAASYGGDSLNPPSSGATAVAIG